MDEQIFSRISQDADITGNSCFLSRSPNDLQALSGLRSTSLVQWFWNPLKIFSPGGHLSKSRDR